jgi:hypothetical protein
LSSLFKFGTRPPAPKRPGRRHNRSWSVYLNNGCKLTVACGQQPCGMINPIMSICEQPSANVPNSERRTWQPNVVLLLLKSGSLPTSHRCDGGIRSNRRHPKGITRWIQPQPDSAQEVGRGYATRAQKTGPRCPLYGFSGCSHARIAPNRAGQPRIGRVMATQSKNRSERSRCRNLWNLRTSTTGCYTSTKRLRTHDFGVLSRRVKRDRNSGRAGWVCIDDDAARFIEDKPCHE